MKKIIAYTVLIMMYLYVNSVQVFAQEDLNNLILNDMKKEKG